MSIDEQTSRRPRRSVRASERRQERRIVASVAAVSLALVGFGVGQSAVASHGNGETLPGQTSSGVQYPFQNTSLSPDQRVQDVISRLTLDEKVGLLHQFSAAVVRLGIPQFRTGTEGLHGLSWLGTATVFPQNTGISMTWNPELADQIGQVIGEEARAYNSVDARFNGIDIWGPVVDPARDPRSGRASESMGEDPFLTGVMATGMAAGIQGQNDGSTDGDFYYQGIPMLKHFVSYGQEASRTAYSANVSPRNLNEYYFPAFQKPIESGAVNGLMTSYNLVNGKPTMVMPEMQDDVYGKWVPGDSKGAFFEVTDAGSPSNLSGSNAYYPNSTAGQAASMADSIKAGVTAMTPSDTDTPTTRRWIYEALARGMVTEQDIDKAIYGVLLVRLHAGDLDIDAASNPYKALTKENALDTPENRAVALDAAREQVVLLKNDDGVLPLSTKDDVALVGPQSDESSTDFYAGTFPYMTLISDKMKAKVDAGHGSLQTSRGVDTVALQVTGGSGAPDGKFLVTGSDASTPLTGTGTSADDPHAQFQLYDYGYNNLLLRSISTDRYVAARGSGNSLVPNADPPGVESQNRASQQWTTDQNLGIVARSGDTVSLRFAKSTGLVAPTAAPNVYVNSGSPFTVQHNGSASSANSKFKLVTVQDGVEDAVAKAKDADVAVVAVGDQPHMTSRETQDRSSSDPGIDLAPQQEKLVDAVAAANPNTVVVIVGSYPFDISAIKANPNVKGIVYTTHAGQELGSAVADVLFGDYAPSGRLNQTWYPGVDSLPAISDYDVIKGGRTYQYHAGDVLFPFGYGLTYATFDYKNFDVKAKKVANTDLAATVPVTVQVRNTGKVASDEVVELYASYDDAATSRVQHPQRTLVGFQRIHLDAGKLTKVNLDVKVKDLAIWDVDGNRAFVEPGSYTIAAQSSSAASDVIASGTLRVTGAGLPDRTLTDVTNADNFDDYSFTSQTSAGLQADIIGTSVHEDDSYGVTVRKAGAWAKYADVDLSKKPAAISLRAANPGTTVADVEVWTGGSDATSGGTQVGTVQVPSTGSAQTFVSVGAALSGLPKATADLYLVFPTANVSVKWLKLGGLTAAKSSDVTVRTNLYSSSIATSLTRYHVAAPASIEQKGGSLVVEAGIKAPAVVTGAATWSVTDTSGNPTTLATIGQTGQLTAAGTADGTVRVVATYPTATGSVQGTADVTLKNQTVAAGTNPEAVIIRSGWDSRPPDISWGPNQFTRMGSIDQNKGSLLLSAVTYPFVSGTTPARPVTFTVTDKEGRPTDLATLVTNGAGFVEGQTSGANNAAFNATLTATGKGDGEVYVKATTENGLSYTSTIVIQGQATHDPYTGRTQAELFDAAGNVGGVAANLRADNVQGDDVGLQLDRIRDGDWAEYRGVDLGNPKNLEMTMRYQKASTAPATITVRADDPVNGPVLGSLSVTGKLGLASKTDYQNPVYSWKDGTLALKPLSGVHDLYLVFGVSPDVPDTDISSTYGAVPGWLDLGINWFALKATQAPVETGPSIDKVSVGDGDTVSGKVTFQVDLAGDAKDVSYTYVELNKGSGQTWVTDNTKAPGSTNAGLHPTLVVDTTALANGAYGLKIDAVGTNGKTTEKKVAFTVNNAPRLSFVTPKDGATVSGKVPVTVDLAGQGLQAYNLRVDSAGLSYAASPKAGEQTFTWDSTTVADGVHTLLATATDDAGNKTTITEKVSVDNAPKVPAWDASKVYTTGDQVSYGGSVWLASWWTQNQKPGDVNGSWQEIATTSDGTAAWTASRIFDAGDKAVYQGVTYQAQWWTRNEKPGAANGPWKRVS